MAERLPSIQVPLRAAARRTCCPWTRVRAQRLQRSAVGLQLQLREQQRCIQPPADLCPLLVPQAQHCPVRQASAHLHTTGGLGAWDSCRWGDSLLSQMQMGFPHLWSYELGFFSPGKCFAPISSVGGFTKVGDHCCLICPQESALKSQRHGGLLTLAMEMGTLDSE